MLRRIRCGSFRPESWHARRFGDEALKSGRDKKRRNTFRRDSADGVANQKGRFSTGEPAFFVCYRFSSPASGREPFSQRTRDFRGCGRDAPLALLPRGESIRFRQRTRFRVRTSGMVSSSASGAPPATPASHPPPLPVSPTAVSAARTEQTRKVTIPAAGSRS